MFFFAAIIRNTLPALLFVVIFILLESIHLYEQSLVILLYIIYMKIDRSNETFRQRFALVIILKWLKNLDSANTHDMRTDIDKLLAIYGNDDLMDELRSTDIEQVKADEMGKAVAGIINILAAIGMIGWLIFSHLA